MTGVKRGWGVGLVGSAGLLLPAALLLVYRFSPDRYPDLYRIGLPILILVAALLCLAGTATAYPRVRNLHLLLPGATVAAVASVMALGALLPGLGGTGGVWLLLLLQLSLPAAILLPSLVNPVMLRRTGAAWGLVLTLAAAGPLLPQGAAVLTRLEHAPPLFPLLLQAALLTATIAVTLLRLRDEFSLGGLISGISFLAGAGWLTAVRPAARPLSLMLTAAIPLFTAAGILVHRIRRMEHRALYDPLLQIYNRGYCDAVLADAGGVSIAPPFSIALFDLDHFKKINDTHGHQAGDAVLHATAQTIRDQLIPEGILCRYGGEELAALFPGLSGRELLSRLEQCRRAVEGLRIPGGETTISVTVSCGVADRSERGETTAEVLKRADAALYRAKQGGRNRVELDERRRRKPVAGAPRSGRKPAPAKKKGTVPHKKRNSP